MQDPLYFWLVLFACAVVLVAVARYVVQPVRLRKRMTYAAHPDILPIDGNRPFPPEAEAFFKQVERPLRLLGYELLGESENPNFAEKIAASNRILINRTTRTMAILIVGYRKRASGEWKFKWTTIAIRTDFADGFHIVTSNGRQLSARPSRPNLKSIRFINIKSPTALHLIHVAFIERHFGSKIPDLILDSKFNGDVVRLSQWFASQEIEQLVQTGYFYHDAFDDKLRPTLKGACLTAWKNSWPWKQSRERYRDREAARVLREIGLNEEGRPRTPPARSYPSEVVLARAAGLIPPDFRGGPEDAPPAGT